MVAVSRVDIGQKDNQGRLRLLYIGPYPDDLKTIFAQHGAIFAPSYTVKAEDALFLSRNFDFEAVIVDQRDDILATRMILPLMACFNKPVKLVVISELSEVDAYKRIPGLAKVVPVPVREHALFRALGIAQGEATSKKAQPSPAIPPTKPKVKVASALPMAPRRATRKKMLKWPQAYIQMGIAAALLVVALGAIGMWRGNWIPDGRTQMSASADTIDKELKQLEERIAQAESAKRAAADAVERSRQNVDDLLQKIGTMLAVAAEPAGKLARERGTVERGQRDVAKAKAWNRSVVQLKERRAQGLMNDDSLKLSILRILKTDEDEHALRLRWNELLAAGEARLARANTLEALADNLHGKRTVLPKSVPSDLLPLIRQAAELLKDKDRSREELDSAERKLEIYIQKTRQVQKKASIVGSLATYCGGFADSLNSCQMG